METLQQPVSAETLNEAASSPKISDVNTNVDSPKVQLKSLLAEARATRDVLVGFRSAIESGSYNGNKMMDLAKGLAFLEAILNQNQAHIRNLQDKLDAPKEVANA